MYEKDLKKLGWSCVEDKGVIHKFVSANGGGF